MVVDLLADVARPSRDLELPAKRYTKSGCELRTMLKVPQAARKPMWSLGHGIIHPRQVGGMGIIVSVAEQDHKAAPEISSQMPVIEIEATHSDWIFRGKIGQHIDPAVRRDSRVDGASRSKREIAQDILRAGRVSEQAESGSA
jgi:hypothetical protein